ncbi:MAG: dolichyl-phosphate beta-glucosyltransferase [Myxococcota bacterium]
MPHSLPSVDLVIPVLNEAHVLEKSVEVIRKFLREEFPYPARVVIADNGSTDGTGAIALALAQRHPDVECVQLAERGRGRALRLAWSRSRADICAYTDVDISTELAALERICRAMVEEGYDLGTGSRLLPQSQVTRGRKRELISRLYNWMVRWVLRTRFSDAQCGFKAVSRAVVEQVVPQVRDESWFFDTELLVLAERQGWRIRDEPVRWVDDDDSRVRIFSTAWEDVKGVARLRMLFWSRRYRRAHPRRSG